MEAAGLNTTAGRWRLWNKIELNGEEWPEESVDAMSSQVNERFGFTYQQLAV